MKEGVLSGTSNGKVEIASGVQKRKKDPRGWGSLWGSEEGLGCPQELGKEDGGPEEKQGPHPEA